MTVLTVVVDAPRVVLAVVVVAELVVGVWLGSERKQEEGWGGWLDGGGGEERSSLPWGEDMYGLHI